MRSQSKGEGETLWARNDHTIPTCIHMLCVHICTQLCGQSWRQPSSLKLRLHSGKRFDTVVMSWGVSVRGMSGWKIWTKDETEAKINS